LAIMSKLFPSVVIGMGRSGAEIATRVADLVATSRELELVELTRTLVLDVNGLFSADAGGDGATLTNADETTALALDTEPASGVWASNYEALLGNALRMRQFIERSVQGVRAFTRAVDLERKSFELGENVTFYLVSSLSEPVGSAALLPLLAAVTEAFHFTFTGMEPRIHLVLLSHDLLPEGPAAADLLKARAHACLQELELVFQGSRHFPYPVQPEFVWLLSARNEENLFLGTHLQLAPVIAHQVLAMLRGEVLRDQSGRTFHGEPVEGRFPRYSSFGFSRIHFPRELLLQRAAEAMVADTLAGLPALAEVEVDAGTVYAEVKGFVQRQHLGHAAELLERDTSGADTWYSYAPPPSVTGHEDAETLLHALRLHDLDYERRTVDQERAIGLRREALVREQSAAVLQHVKAVVADDSVPGAVARAEAWLAALTEEPCAWIRGDVATERLTLKAVDNALHDYFDPLFTPLLFPNMEDAESQAYAVEQHISPSDLRKLVQALAQDFRERARQLEEGLAQQAGRQPPEGASPGTAQKEVPANAAEAPVMAAAAGTAEEPPAPVRAEERRGAKPGAAQWAAHRGEEFLQSVADGAQDQYLESLQEALGRLEPLYSRVLVRVQRLDYAIDNAAERARLFRAVLEAARARMEKSIGEFREGARAYRGKRAELEAWAEQRKLWLVRAGLVTGSGLLLAAFLMIRYEALRGAPWWVYALLLSLGAGVGGWWYWTAVGRQYRALREQTAAARTRRDHLRDAMVSAHQALRRREYDNHRFDTMVRWRDDLASYVRALRHGIRQFREELIALGDRAQAISSRFELPDSPFLAYLLPAGGVAELIAGHADEIAVQVRDLWRQTPLSTLLVEFLSSRSADTLHRLRGRIAGRTQEVFQELAGMTAEDFLARTMPEAAARRSYVAKLYRVAAPFAMRVNVIGGAADQIAYIGAQDRGVVRDALEPREAADFFKSAADTEISILRLALRFPAFQFAPMEEARAAAQQLPGEVRAGLYVDPGWLGEIQELKPSVFRLGSADDRKRKLACLALVFGVAERIAPDDGGGEHIRYAGQEFGSYDAWVLHLGQLAGARDATRVEDEMGRVRERLRTERSDPAEILRAYLAAHPGLDPVDREIIEAEIDGLT
jgi:predicted  nucleic acid-binding Zn-ribbon protein